LLAPDIPDVGRISTSGQLERLGRNGALLAPERPDVGRISTSRQVELGMARGDGRER
jgi:hypothetical protein